MVRTGFGYHIPSEEPVVFPLGGVLFASGKVVLMGEFFYGGGGGKMRVG